MFFTMIVLINTVDSLDSLISSQSTKQISARQSLGEPCVMALGCTYFSLREKSHFSPHKMEKNTSSETSMLSFCKAEDENPTGTKHFLAFNDH